ncbi:MAG: hypothetical protein ACFCU1_01665 [Sumerlaeia bacterium]
MYLSCLAMCSPLAARPYNGVGPGTSVINAAGGADYTSLQQATNAVNAFQ